MTSSHRSAIWSTLIILGICALFAAALPSPGQATVAAAPPRPTLTPTLCPTSSPTPSPTLCPTSSPAPSPTLQPASRTASAGGRIALYAQFSQTWPWANIHWQDLWTIVQWQDVRGEWHDVAGWQGGLNSVEIGENGEVVGQQVWWVAQADLGKGPFRWLVYQGKESAQLVESDSFYLPHHARETTHVWILLASKSPTMPQAQP